MIKVSKMYVLDFTCMLPSALHFLRLLHYLDGNVKPMLKVNVQDCGGDLKKLCHQFTLGLASGQLSELNQLSVRIMQATCDGRLANHPAAMGIVLQCVDLVDREARGISTLKKPRQMSDIEQGLVEEAAILLATNGCHKDALRQLGFSKASILRNHSRLDNLMEQSLPCPALAILWPDVLESNLAIIDAMYERNSGSEAKQRMVLCFDFTYLLQLQTCLKLHGHKSLVGSPFTMKDMNSERPGCFQKIVPGEPVEELRKANRMLLVLVQTFFDFSLFLFIPFIKWC